MGDVSEEPDAATRVEDRPLSSSDAALDRYRRRMRPLRIGYAVAIVGAVVIALVVVKIAYVRGEISHVHLHIATSVAPSISNAPTPTPTLAKLWSSTDTSAIGTPVDVGTVVTHDGHTVRGRDALTGTQTWSYTRSDRSVCTSIQTSSVTIAVYRLHGDCDELTALDSQTGARRWTRTLDKDGAEFDGPATYAVNGSTVMFVSHTSIYAISSGGTADGGDGGLDYWVFHHGGCIINGAVLGNAGALISQTCHGENCDGHKFCGDGTQLLLRDQTTGTDDKSTTNPDIVKWNDLGTNLIPTSAGQTVTARDPGGATLHEFDAKTGKDTAQLALAGDSGASAPSAVTTATDADLIWIGGHTYALTSGEKAFRWQAATTGLPTTQASNSILAGGDALAPTSAGAALLDTGTGRVMTRYPIAAPAPGSTIYPLGTGLLVAGPDTVVYR
jgi:hypothetical protein